jgi:hypothetical protein
MLFGNNSEIDVIEQDIIDRLVNMGIYYDDPHHTQLGIIGTEMQSSYGIIAIPLSP